VEQPKVNPCGDWEKLETSMVELIEFISYNSEQSKSPMSPLAEAIATRLQLLLVFC